MSVGDDTPGASERAARCHAEFSRLLDPYYLARLSAVRGLIAIRDRQGQSARGFFRQAAHDTLKDGDNWLSSDAWAQCAWLAVSGGNVKEARFALGEAQRCEKRASQGRPQITRVCAEAAVLVMERCAKDVDELVETALVHLGLRAVSTTQSVSSVSLGFLHGVRGIARFIEADLDGAGRCFEEALANCEQRPAVSSYWLFWLALAQASLGANVTAEDTFHSALEMNRLAPEWPDETNALAAIFGARVLGAGSACVVGMNAAAAVHSLQAQLSAGHGTGEARLALIALGHDDAAAVTLSVSEDVRAFEVTGTNATLASGSPQRAVLRSLLEAHDRQPGTPMSTDELIAAAWPGETLVGDSGPNRLRVAISRLRKLGLGDLIVSHPGGYALVQGLIVEVRPSEGTHGMQRVMRCN